MSLDKLEQHTLDEIAAEFERASAKHARRTPRDSGMVNGERLAILGEEFGEVCRALTYDQPGDWRKSLHKELIQLAAMAAAWAEAT